MALALVEAWSASAFFHKSKNWYSFRTAHPLDYQNLVHLASKAFTEGFYYKPRIDVELLAERSAGLIGLSGGIDGAVGHFLANGNEEKALKNAKTLEEIIALSLKEMDERYP